MHLWAVGSASQLSYHGARRGAFSLALGSGSVAVEVTAIAKAKVLHGVLMMLGWGVPGCSSRASSSGRAPCG